MGLTLCVVAGGDLFTSNCMYAAIGASEGGRAGRAGRLRAARCLSVPATAALMPMLCSPGSRSQQVHRQTVQPQRWTSLPCRPACPCAGRFGLYGWGRMLLVSYLSNLVGRQGGVGGAGWLAAAGMRMHAAMGRSAAPLCSALTAPPLASLAPAACRSAPCCWWG